MTEQENVQQIKVLEKIRQQVAANGSPLYSGCGLCYNVENQGGSRIQPALYALGLTFEPIPHYHIHQDRRTLWSGKQRELRLALIEKLINYYQSKIKMLKALLALQAHIEKHGEPPMPAGLCSNLEALAQGSYPFSELYDAFEAVGFNRYEPIPDYNWNYMRRTLWVGVQRELRLALIEKLITYYQEQN